MDNDVKKYNRKDFLKSSFAASLILPFMGKFNFLQLNYTIFISTKNDTYEKDVATFLQSEIKRNFGKNIDIKTFVNINSNNYGIYLINIQTGLTKDSFNISTDQVAIKIEGNKRGLLFGCGELLNKYYGIKKNDITDGVPINKTFSLPQNLNISSKPDFDYRFFYQELGFDKKYEKYNKLSEYYIEKESGWNGLEDTGSIAHNFLRLFGYDKYFNNHPEYYPFINNQRTSEGLKVNDARRMPCLSNEGVYLIIKKELTLRMNQNPDLKIWNLSQPDGIAGPNDYCNCKLCKPKHDAGNGLSETLFPFINRLAADFPNKIIRTLAYNITAAPHKGISTLSDGRKLATGEMMPNVEIMFTLTDNDKSQPLATSSDIKAVLFRQYIDQWSQKGVKLFIWEYIVNFNYYLFPFPTIHTIKDNFTYFRSKNVKSLFIQCSSMEQSSFSELNAFIYSKMMWDSSQDINLLIEEFCKDFYGNASQEMNAYILTLLANAKNNKGTSLNPFSGIGSMVYLSNPDPITQDSVLFSPKHMNEYLGYVKAALNKTKGTKYYNSILKEYACLLFVQIEAATYYANKNGKFSSTFYSLITEKNRYKFSDIKDRFASICKQLNIKYISENLRTVDSYLNDVGDLQKR